MKYYFNSNFVKNLEVRIFLNVRYRTFKRNSKIRIFFKKSRISNFQKVRMRTFLSKPLKLLTAVGFFKTIKNNNNKAEINNLISPSICHCLKCGLLQNLNHIEILLPLFLGWIPSCRSKELSDWIILPKIKIIFHARRSFRRFLLPRYLKLAHRWILRQRWALNSLYFLRNLRFGDIVIVVADRVGVGGSWLKTGGGIRPLVNTNNQDFHIPSLQVLRVDPSCSNSSYSSSL